MLMALCLPAYILPTVYIGVRVNSVLSNRAQQVAYYCEEDAGVTCDGEKSRGKIYVVIKK